MYVCGIQFSNLVERESVAYLYLCFMDCITIPLNKMLWAIYIKPICIRIDESGSICDA